MCCFEERFGLRLTVQLALCRGVFVGDGLAVGGRPVYKGDIAVFARLTFESRATGSVENAYFEQQNPDGKDFERIIEAAISHGEAIAADERRRGV